MKKGSGIFNLCSLFLCFLFNFNSYAQQTIRDKDLNLELKLPDSLIEQRDVDNEGDTADIYYDASAGVIFMISGRKSIFKDIKNYLDCSREGLEQELRTFQGDSTLKLMSCNRSAYYPEKSVVLHFETNAYSPGLNRCIVYFIHHKSEEIQLFFLYKKTKSDCLDYIDKIMKSLVLL
jgi:hypothetical protein